MTDNKLHIDDYLQTTAIGSREAALSNYMYGFNHRKTPNAYPMHRDLYGYTFFVRPQLNLQDDNIRSLRRFFPLLNKNERSLHRYVRCMLDPRLMENYKISDNSTVLALKCPLVDNKNAFIPLMTNSLKTLTGWPDIVTHTFDSKPGLYGESYTQVDGTCEIYNSVDLDATFINIKNSPLIYLLNTWIAYQSKVFEGTLVPYPDFILENEIDYNTRIYRIVLAHDNRTVTKIAATGISIVVSSPMGAFFDYNADEPYNNNLKEFSTRFHSLGAMYNDAILMQEFNSTVQIFNPSMGNKLREINMKKVPYSELQLFNFKGYPWIDTGTNTLDWWVEKNMYESRMTSISKYYSDNEGIIPSTVLFNPT
jgi:hypothetical protein